jgi:hypothetical protein
MPAIVCADASERGAPAEPAKASLFFEISAEWGTLVWTGVGRQEIAMYIDPAAGSLILQLVAAGFFAALASIKRVRESVRRLFQTLFGRTKK